MIRFCYVSCFWVLLALSITSCRPEGEVVREDKNTFSVADQAKIGQTFKSHILNNPIDYDLYMPESYPEVYSYLNETMLKLVVNTATVVNRSEFNWELNVVRDDEIITAYTLPGGKLFITSGFLKFLTSESQLLAVISHEMCHSDGGIVMEILKDNYSGLLLGDLVFNNTVDEVEDMIRTLQEAELAEDQVKAADEYAVEILCPFNYSPEGIISIMENITDNDYPLEWFTIRPEYSGRMDTIKSFTVDCGAEVTIEAREIEEQRYKDSLLKYLD